MPGDVACAAAANVIGSTVNRSNLAIHFVVFMFASLIAVLPPN
jgi:hypothetical protein